MIRHLGILRGLALLAVLCCATLGNASHARADGARLEGRLRERGTRKPLKDVNVYLIPQAPETPATAVLARPLKAVTDKEGRFFVENVPAGRFKWIVNLTGYDRLEQNDELPPGAPQPFPPRELYLEKASYLGAYETTIYDKAQKRDDKTKSISGDEISKLAGASNDPIKAVQDLPGVNRSSGFSPQVIIEGSSPNDTIYLIDGQEVPLIFHFGAFTTVVPPESVDRVDLLTSGFGVDYGRTTAGLVSVWLKTPRNDRLHGEGYLDLFNVGAMLEGPAGEHGEFFLGARQSYIGLVLKAALKGNSNFDLSVAPDFGDLTGIYQQEVTPIDTFRLVEVGSLDTLNFIFNEPVSAAPSVRGSFSELTGFFRLMPEWVHRHSPRTTSRLSFGFGKDWVRVDTGDIYLHVSEWALTNRFEVEHEFSPYWKSELGIDNAVYWTWTEFQLPKIYAAGGVANPFSVSTIVNANVYQSYAQLGPYWRNEIRLGDTPWTLVPGVRVEYYNITGETIPEPRLQLRYRLTDSVTLRSASGLYAIAPQPQETAPAYGNPNLRMPLAAHVTAGTAVDFRHGASNGWDLVADLFYKHFYRMVIPSYATLPDGSNENYNNDGHGRAYGLEAQAKYNYGPLSGWLTYTLSRSTRWDPNAPEAVSHYDQTHNLAAVLSLERPYNWQISTRFRLVSGNPYTPITGGVLDTDNDVYIPVAGSFYSERVAPFWQLDLRIDKKWIYDKWILSAYLDIQNVTNHTNVEAIRYSYDYAQTTTVAGLPFLPILGMKGEF
jgi:outer membrane receptor protein involved in Fe transport